MNPGFVTSIAQRNKILVFEPTFNAYYETLLNVYDMMTAAVMKLPRLETNLCFDREGSQAILEVCFLCCSLCSL